MTIEIRKAHRKTLSRGELFDLVWDRPMTKVALELGVSDVAVRKICVKHKIPRPAQGHWAASKPKSKPESLPSVPRHMEQISIYVPEKVVGRAVASGEEAGLPEEVENVIAKGIPTRLAHGLGATYSELRKGEPDRYGYCRPSYKRSTHEVIATKASLRRALYLMEYIFRVCEAAGFSVKSNDDCSYNRWSMSSWVCRNDVRVSVRVKSSVKQVALDKDGGISDFHKYTYIDTGKLSVTIGSSVTVRESEALTLEDKMPEIYRKLVKEHEAQVERARQRKIEAEKYETRRWKEQIATMAREVEKRQADNLEAFKLQLIQIEENRRFYSAVASHSELENIEGFADWIGWSKQLLPTEIEQSVVPALQRHHALAAVIAELKKLDPSDSELCYETLYQLSLRLNQSGYASEE